VEISESLDEADFILTISTNEHSYMVRAIEAFLLSNFETDFNERK